MYINKIENRINFKIKAGYHLDLLKPKTMNLLGSTKIKYLKIKIIEMYLMYKLMKKY